VRPIVVLPTYNERDNLDDLLRAIRAAHESVEVLIVDDSSPDGTADLARSLGAELGGVSVLVRTEKTGLGSAYRAGFSKVLAEGYDVIVSMDGDLSHDPAVIPVMLERIAGGASVVIGSRYVDGGGTPDWPYRRRFLSKWGNAYTRAVLRLEPHDCTSGFRAYTAEALAAIEPHTTSAEGYAFLTELVRRLKRHDIVVEETPIIFRQRIHGKSKMSWRIIVESMLRVSLWAVDDLRAHRPRTAD
jgi:dolichol-phosphate mannosyltransferase